MLIVFPFPFFFSFYSPFPFHERHHRVATQVVRARINLLRKIGNVPLDELL